MALRTLYQALLDSDPARLRVIAYLWDLELQTSRKTDMAAEIVNAIASAEAVARFLERMSPEERAAIDDLMRDGGALPWNIFERQWGEVRSAGPGRVEREELWRAPVSAAEALWYAGWVHRTFEQRAERPRSLERAVEMAFVPEDLMLYTAPPPAKEIPAPPQTSAPEVHSCAEDSLADDLVTLWSAAQRTDDVWESLLAQFHPPAAQRLSLLETLSVESNWLRRGDGGRLQPVPDAIVRWLQSDAWSQWSSLIKAWMGSQQWNDLARVDTLTPDPVKGWLHDPQSARQAFLEILTRCEPGCWVEITAFIDYIRNYGTDFLRPDGDYNSWAPRDTRTESPLRGFEAWHAVEGALISFLIHGPLHWLGLVDLGRPEPDAPPVAFRLTAAAAAILHEAEAPEFPDSPPVELTETAELVVPPRRRYERFQLNRIADPISAPDGYRYRLSPSSLRRAKQQRIAYERIVTFLKQATHAGSLPAHITTAMQRIHKDDTGASLARRWVLHIPDPQLLASPALQALIDEQLTDELVTVRNEAWPHIVRLLLQQGMLTDVEEG
jgi:hypothetical protein